MTLHDLKSPSNGPVSALVQIQQVQNKVTKSNKPYLEITLVDAVDTTVWRLWSDHPQFDDQAIFEVGNCLNLYGLMTIGDYGLEGQIEVKLQTEEEKATFFSGDPALQARQEADFNTIVSLAQSIQDPRLKEVSMLFLKKFGNKLKRTAAAKKNHHARCGGLVEHVAQMMRSADALCKVYTNWNRDLLLAGVLFHDCGKLWENTYAPESFVQQTTLIGELTSHIPLGMEILNRLWGELLASPTFADKSLQPDQATCRLHLLHLIASHHGQLDYGSPVYPKTPEAFALHFIDNIDAKNEMCQMSYSDSSEVQNDIYERMFPLPTGLVAPLGKINEN